MQARTIREFPCPKDFWPQVETWAAETGFILHRKEAGLRTFRKGHWLLMAPAWVEIRQEGKVAVLEAWVKADSFLLLSLLAGKKPETAIDSGGLIASVPRRRAREAVNRLLTRIGQPPVA